MRAGRLRHRITIEQATPTQDDFGQEIIAWSTLATVWAEKRDLSGRELFQAQQVSSQVTTQFRIRHRTDVGGGERIVHDGVTYNIEAPQDPTGREVELLLLCSRTAN